MTKPIIDLSYFNNVTDWNAVKENVAGVIIRMGYRGYSKGGIVYDNKYKQYRAAVERLNIPHSFYFFTQAINDEEAIQEANFIANELEDAGDLMGPVWIDSEIADVEKKNGRADKLSVSKRTWFIKVICETLKSRGITCGVYASTSWLNNNLNMGLLEHYPVWVAQYNTKCTYSGAYILWQYSSKAIIPGIKNGVDVSVVNVPEIQSDVMSEDLKAAINVLAVKVLQGKFGTGHDNRKEQIYNLVKNRVNELCK